MSAAEVALPGPEWGREARLGEVTFTVFTQARGDSGTARCPSQETSSAERWFLTHTSPEKGAGLTAGRPGKGQDLEETDKGALWAKAAA